MKFRFSFRSRPRLALFLASVVCVAGVWTASTGQADDPLVGETAPASAPATGGLDYADRLASAFDGQRAFADLELQVSFGPRLPGSSASYAMLDWLEGELSASGFAVARQFFAVDNPLGNELLEGSNVVASIRPDAPKVFLFTCHFDCRAKADRDPEPANRRFPVPGANDGASGVAVLTEMARVVAANPLPDDVGLMLVFFDIEDQGRSRENQSFCLGSLEFARQFDRSIEVAAAVNLDMVGDADLLFLQERHSLDKAPEVLNAFWSHGEALFPKHFSRKPLGYVFDDHVRLQDIGLPAIDVIDFDYPAWHTTYDLPSACSPESLRATGATALSFLGAGGAPRFR